MNFKAFEKLEHVNPEELAVEDGVEIFKAHIEKRFEPLKNAYMSSYHPICGYSVYYHSILVSYALPLRELQECGINA